jgi:hypothetical protein
MVKIQYKRINHLNYDSLEDDDDELIYYNTYPNNKLIIFLIRIICGKYYTKIFDNKYN